MRTTDTGKELLSRAEVAQIFEVSAATIGRWTREGKLPYRKTLGGQHRYPREEVERLSGALSSHEVGRETEMERIDYRRAGRDARATGLLAVLARAAEDDGFLAMLAHDPDAALAGFTLTQPERAALAGGDVRWIEERYGRLDEKLATWLRLRLQQEDEHISATRAAKQSGVHAVLSKAATDERFLALLAESPEKALMDFDLTQMERAALASGDINWIEKNFGKLDDKLSTWFQLRMQQEAW